MKIPVILVTGFLGSGKTTFLRRLAASHPQWRLVFVVNEFAEANIDGDSLAATGTPTQSVVGGCLFCECRAGEFIRVMRDDLLCAHRENPLDAVVIETSGIANPDAIGRLMADHGLTDDFELHRVAAVVAPAKFLKLAENLPVIGAQVRASDLVIINKTDTATADMLVDVERWIRARNPSAQLVRAEWCQMDFQLNEALPKLTQGTLSTVSSNPYTTKTLRFNSRLSHADFLSWLDSLPPEILRLKGTVQTDAGWFHLQKTVDTMELAPTGPELQSTLVLIVHDDETAALRSVRQQFNRIQS